MRHITKGPCPDCGGPTLRDDETDAAVHLGVDNDTDACQQSQPEEIVLTYIKGRPFIR